MYIGPHRLSHHLYPPTSPSVERVGVPTQPTIHHPPTFCTDTIHSKSQQKQKESAQQHKSHDSTAAQITRNHSNEHHNKKKHITATKNTRNHSNEIRRPLRASSVLDYRFASSTIHHPPPNPLSSNTPSSKHHPPLLCKTSALFSSSAGHIGSLALSQDPKPRG